MSQVSALSNQYERLMSVSSLLNEAIITLKKKIFLEKTEIKRKYPKLSVSEKEIKDATTYLLKFLRSIQKLILEEEDKEASPIIPWAVAKEYQSLLKKTDPYIAKNIKGIIETLEKEENLNKNQFNALDNTLSAVDLERTAVFKKLRLGRG